MAEVHFVGSIMGASGFALGLGQGLVLHYQVITPLTAASDDVSPATPPWQLLEGSDTGTTHVDVPAFSSEFCVWSQPLDLHYVTSSVQGWPKLVCQVYRVSVFGRYELGKVPISTCWLFSDDC